MNTENDNGYCLYGAEAMRQRLPALIEQIPHVRTADDIEGVHQMRVASRRLRAAFALFAECLPAKRAATWEAAIRRITKSLGAARDTDVQFEWLTGFLAGASDPAWRPGINRLLLRLYQKRQELQRKVLKALDRLEASRTLDELGSVLHEQVVQARLQQVDAHAPDVYRRAAEAIELRLAEFLAYDVFVHQPERAVEHHQMRIAAKHLRYTLEIFDELYEDGLKKPIKTAKQIQEMLGDVHDCDVWCAFVPEFMEAERQRTLDYFGTDNYAQRFTPGLLALQADRQQHRAERYQEFVKFWDKTLETDTWGRLRQTIQSVPVAALSPVEAVEAAGEESDAPGPPAEED
jgi:CHAD domain-containing protein